MATLLEALFANDQGQNVGTKTIIRKDKNTSNEHFVWSFNDVNAVRQFKNAKHGDIITSEHIEIDGCTFYFELTPNGWSRFNGTVVWCALQELPADVYSVEVYFKYVCDEINFSGIKTKTLTTLKKANISKVGVHSFSSDNVAKYDKFSHLNSFSFKCYVKVKKWFDKNGKQIQIQPPMVQQSKIDDNTHLKIKNIELREENTQLSQRLTDYVQQTSLLEAQNKQITSEKEQLQQLVDDLLKNQMKLETENTTLKTNNDILMDECKELRLELNETKQKYKELAKKITLDVRNYKQWDYDNITEWIINLNDEYAKYEKVLRKKLKEEAMTGDLLHEIDKSDLDRFGIKSFKDKSSIIKHIQSLTSQPKVQENEGGTAYI